MTFTASSGTMLPLNTIHLDVGSGREGFFTKKFRRETRREEGTNEIETRRGASFLKFLTRFLFARLTTCDVDSPEIFEI